MPEVKFPSLSKKRFALLAFSFALIFIGIFGLIFSGQSNRFPLDSDQYGDFSFVEIENEDYDALIESEKSFLLLIDQNGCITAEGLKSILEPLATEHGIRVYRMMYSDMRQTSLFDKIKYYPSVAIINKGTPVAWLRADSDEDVNRYKDKEELSSWLDTYIEWN